MDSTNEPFEEETENFEKRRKISFPVIAFVLVIAAAGWCLYQYETNKPYSRVTQAETTVTMNATDLYDQFLKNEKLAGKNYIDKMLVIKGNISAVASDSGRTIVFLGGTATDSAVKCALHSTVKEDSLFLQKGNLITIKGRCVSFQNKVILTDGRLIH